MKKNPGSPKRGVRSRDSSLGKDSRRNRRRAYQYLSKYNNNKHNMEIYIERNGKCKMKLK